MFTTTNTLIWVIAAVAVLQNVALLTKCQQKVPINSPLQKQIKMNRSTTSTARKTISLMASINYAGPLFAIGTMCTKSMQLALDRVGQMPNVLADYDLVIEPYDDLCTRAVMIRQAIDRVNNNIDISKTRMPLALGCICMGHLFTGQMLHYYNFIGVTATTTVPDLQMYRQKYRGYYVLAVSPGIAYQGLIEFIQAMGWRKIAIYSEIAPYWQTLETQVVNDLEKRNMTLLGLVKVPNSLPTESEIRTAIEDLNAVQPRIILLNSNTPARVACYLHRYGMYGPHYVYFLQVVLSFLPNDPSRYPWCTEKMLTEVMESLIIFGDSAKGDIFGLSESDATGLTTAQYLDSVQAAISDKLADNANWPFWGLLCYEMAFFAAYWLDHVESFLRQRNETLSDWVASGDKFQQNGTVFYDLVLKSLYSFKLKGLRGDYAFDPTTDDNTGSGSFSPSGFFQNRATSDKTVEKVPIGYYKVSDKNRPLVVKWDKVVWETLDGKPPPDSIRILNVAIPLVDEPSYAAFSAIGSIIIAINAAFLVLQCVRTCQSRMLQNSLRLLNNTILLGNCILVAHVFCLPQGVVPDVHLNCTAAYALIVVGGSIVICSMWAKMEVVGLTMIKKARPDRKTGASTLNSTAGAPRQPVASTLSVNLNKDHAVPKAQTVEPSKFDRIYAAVLALAISTVIIIGILCAIWLSVDPVRTKIIKGTLVTSKHDVNFLIQPNYHTCEMPDTPNSLGTIGAICAMLGIILVRSALLSFAHKSLYCRYVSDFNLVGICIYLLIVGMFAGIILAIIFLSDAAKLQLVVSAFMIFISSLNVAVIFLPKIFQLGGYFKNDDVASAPANGTSIIVSVSTNPNPDMAAR